MLWIGLKQKLSKKMASDIFLGIGSNKGDKHNFILQAVKLIDSSEKCKVIKFSSIYETTPYGDVKQENFLNAVIQINSSFTANELFRYVKSVETSIGRKSAERWGPREIDVDILFYNSLIYNSDDLIIPHLEAMKRDFVVVPMTEIAPEFIHPVAKSKMKEFDISTIESHIVAKTNFRIR